MGAVQESLALAEGWTDCLERLPSATLDALRIRARRRAIYVFISIGHEVLTGAQDGVCN